MIKKKYIILSFILTVLVTIIPQIAYGATKFNLTDGITNPLDINSHYTKVANGIYEPKPTANYNNGVFVKNTIIPTDTTNQTILDDKMNRYKITGTGYIVKISPNEKIIWAIDIKSYIAAIYHDEKYIGEDDDGSLWEDTSDYYNYLSSVNIYYYHDTLCLYYFTGSLDLYFNIITLNTNTGELKYKNDNYSLPWYHMPEKIKEVYFNKNFMYIYYYEFSFTYKINIGNLGLSSINAIDSNLYYKRKIFNSDSFINLKLEAANEVGTNKYFEFIGDTNIPLFSTENIISDSINVSDDRDKVSTFKLFNRAVFFKDNNGTLLERFLINFNNSVYVYNGFPGMSGVKMDIVSANAVDPLYHWGTEDTIPFETTNENLLDPFYLAEITKGSYVRAYIKNDNIIIRWLDDKLNCINEKSFNKGLFNSQELQKLITKETYYMPMVIKRNSKFWLPDRYFYDSISFTSLVGLDFNTYYYGIKPTLTPVIKDYIVGDNTDIVLTGSVKDNNNTNGICTVTATINGVSKSITTTGAYTITFNSAEIGQGKYDVNVTVTDGDKISNSMLAGSVDIEYTLKEFISRLNLLGKSGLSRISVLDMDSRKIDNNTENQKLIATIADRLNTNNIGLYAIDGGNEVIKELSSMIK